MLLFCAEWPPSGLKLESWFVSLKKWFGSNDEIALRTAKLGFTNHGSLDVSVKAWSGTD